MKKPLVFFYGWFCYLFILPSYHCSQAKILINEVLPYPEDGVEAAELVFIPDNSQETEINLKDWSIWDELTSPSCLYIFEDEILTVNEFLVKTFNSKLNNAGDSIIIKNPSGEISDKFSYTFSEKDFSYSRISHDQDDFLLSIPTLGDANIFPSPTLIPTPTPSTDDSQSASNIIEDSEEPQNFTFQKNISNESEKLFTHDDQPQKNLEDLKDQQEELTNKILRLKKSIEENQAQDFQIAKSSDEAQFISTLTYNTVSISSIGIVSVIIGGLFFLITSKIIYE